MDKLFHNERMMALSWKQPFGTAMLHGKVETRTWWASYQGLVLICTSKRPYDLETVRKICGGDRLFFAMCQQMKSDTSTLDLNGYAIGIGRLVSCSRMEIRHEEKSFVKHQAGLFCHFYEDVRPIKPFEWKGSVGWKKVDEATIKKIELV